ncbi:hypothetical protein FACS189490_05540 [Clostridia bacterium]|nr:hypothetical protein FACS189490_05540 [Clostridia bacterium]
MDFSKLPLELKLARFSFLLRKAYPFLGELSLLTERVFSTDTVLAGVENNKLHLNRQEVNALPEAQFNFVILHELLHILFGHQYPANMAASNRSWANIAMDLTVNYAIAILQGDLRAKSLPTEPQPAFIVPHMLDDLSKWDILTTRVGSNPYTGAASYGDHVVILYRYLETRRVILGKFYGGSD